MKAESGCSALHPHCWRSAHSTRRLKQFKHLKYDRVILADYVMKWIEWRWITGERRGVRPGGGHGDECRVFVLYGRSVEDRESGRDPAGQAEESRQYFFSSMIPFHPSEIMLIFSKFYGLVLFFMIFLRYLPSWFAFVIFNICTDRYRYLFVNLASGAWLDKAALCMVNK